MLLREAGRGGMSVVYEARDVRIGRRVAIKVVSVPLHMTAMQREALLARLGREARAIARLSHPNIVSIFDVGEETDRHFLVMEYLDGETLRDRLADRPLSPVEASRILDQVAGALDAVHAEGVVHRDVKPSNMMLLPDGRVKLMDFGVARQAEDTLVTQAGMMVGSPAYMAPELINGEEATNASDLWSLGVLLYEILAGHAPFTGHSIANVLYQITHTPIPPIANVSPAVQNVLTRAMDRDPVRRYPSARALADAFREATAPRQPRTPAALVSPTSKGRSHAPWALAALLLTAVAGGTLLHSQRSPTRAGTGTGARADQKPVPAAAGPPHTGMARQVMPAVPVAAVRQERHLPPHYRRHHRHVFFPLALAPQIHHSLAVTALETGHLRTRHVHRLVSLPPATRRAFRHHAVVPADETLMKPVEARRQPLGLVGTWRGTHSHNPATLTITRSRPGGFDGVMTVRTPEALVHVAVAGRVSGDHVSIHETRVLSESRPRAWDLGSESGSLASGGRMAGTGTDIKGRFGRWSFSR